VTTGQLWCVFLFAEGLQSGKHCTKNSVLAASRFIGQATVALVPTCNLDYLIFASLIRYSEIAETGLVNKLLPVFCYPL
jgi:hypothetical protein